MLGSALRVVLCCVVLMVEASEYLAKEPVVEISSGRVKGYVSSSQSGRDYYSFQAIPYAKPPINSLRFKPPEAVDDWEGIRDGTQLGEQCAQIDHAIGKVVGVEDCLFLNVYTPKLESEVDVLLPVLFWIHGGGFIMGSGRNDLFGPQHFMDHPVVLVTINYRLGIVGYLNTEDEKSFGNYGMLDQVMALKWVQKNIVSFGGDPGLVTIFGVSAGSASAIYHMLTPLSTGLFHKAIAQSGTPTNHWALLRNPLHYAKRFANHVKCPNSNDTKSIVDCLSDKPINDLVYAESSLKPAYFYPLELAPSVEAKGGPGFITEDPHRQLYEGKIVNKVPMIIGVTQDEGYSLYFNLASTFKSTGKRYFETEFPHHLPLFSSIQPHMTWAIKEIEKNYYENKNLEDEDTFIDVGQKIHGDALFGARVAQTVEQLSQARIPIYAYIYNHLGYNCLAQFYGGKCGKYCSHADEYFLLFRFASMKLKTPDDVKMSSILTSYWTAFASNSDLHVDNERWPVYDVVNRNYLELTLTPTIKQGLLSNKTELWTQVLPNLVDFQIVKDEL